MLKIIVFFSLILCVYAYADICAIQNKSCSAQIWDNAAEDNRCHMVYYKKNSRECVLKEYKLRHSSTDFGYVKLEPYVDTPVARTVFNVTFYNIKWDYFKMRFKQVQFGPKYVCRDFYIEQEAIVPSHSVLHYDCPWTDASYEGQVVNFEFEYGSNKMAVGKKYTFTVPKHEELDKSSLSDLKLFLYVEQCDSRWLILKIQVPPENFQVEYLIVDVFRARNNLTNKEDTRTVSTARAKYGEIMFEYNTYGEYGDYSFTVRFDHPDCAEHTCMVSRTPLIIIPKTSRVLTIGIVGVVGLIPVIFIVLYIWRRQCLKQDTLYRANQSILLVPYPHNDANISVVTTLARLLERTLKLKVMLDITDVPKFQSKDPFDWYTTHFTKATHIVFLLSQENRTTKQIVYKDVDKLAINLMKMEFKSCTKQFSLITFPYSQTPPPDSLSTLKRFKFMSEFSDFVNYLHKMPFLLRMEEKIDFVGDELYDQLRDAIKTAEKNITIDESPCLPGKDLNICIKDKLLSPITQEFKTLPEKRDAGNYLYKANELNLSGNVDKQDATCQKKVKKSAFDGLAL